MINFVEDIIRMDTEELLALCKRLRKLSIELDSIQLRLNRAYLSISDCILAREEYEILNQRRRLGAVQEDADDLVRRIGYISEKFEQCEGALRRRFMDLEVKKQLNWPLYEEAVWR